MPVIIETKLDPNVTAEDYLKVSALIDERGAPDGLILHTGAVVGDGIRVTDVWESREQYDSFVQAHLIPALVEVFGQEAVSQAPPANPAVHETLDLRTP